MKPIQVGLLGIGTVGRGTFDVLRRNEEEIRRRAGREIRIAMVADLDSERARRIVGDAAEVVDDARRVIANPAIDIVAFACTSKTVGLRMNRKLPRISRMSAITNFPRRRSLTPGPASRVTLPTFGDPSALR